MQPTYVKFGLAGYGPELDSEDTACETVAELCGAIQQELGYAAEQAFESTAIEAENGDYESAYNGRVLCDALDTLGHSLDYDARALAPLYRGSVELLESTLLGIVRDAFPLDVSVDGYSRLYVWEVSD